MDPYLGEIRMFAGNFAPRGYAFCNGQLMAISQNTALFALLGTQFGGDGRTTFALPNMQGSTPLNYGQGAGLSNYVIGQAGGEASHTLITSELPSHNHLLTADGTSASSANPGGALFGKFPGRTSGLPYYASSSSAVAMASNAVLPNTGGQAHSNQQAFLAVTFIIALQGVFPPRQ